MRESDMYPAIKGYLERHGYQVKSEVKGCDVTAVRDGDLVIVEMKTALNMRLLAQAVERQRISDSVYVAVPHPGPIVRTSYWRHVCHLLRRLELGLLLVTLVPCPRVEVTIHPMPFEKKRQSSRRRALLTEIEARSGDHNQGGSTKVPLVTAYRQNAIKIARILKERGPTSPRELRALGTGPKTASILYDNHYGWFVRVERGVYDLTGKGLEDLDNYAGVSTDPQA